VVEGLESLKREIHLQFIWPFQEKKIYQEFGREAEGSLLLYGPPGCGKTFFCYATAGETLRPFYKIHLEEILDSYIGLTERNLSDLFEQARQESPSILFLEQIDALTQHSQSPGVLPQLLQQLEALSRQKILLLATSHQPWILPESAFSAHRFERLYFVPPPSLKQRSQLLTRFLQKKPVAIPSFNDLAKETEWYTCAELPNAHQTST
jgi:transitional endoplasmic reticulum ATPase